MIRRWGFAGALPCLALVALSAPKLPVFRDHFARAAGNVAEQQVAVGLALREGTPPDARLLVGDAGAIPFFSGRSAIDALGLGGFRGIPFVRAATFGEAATLELLESLPPAERPTHFALYASWFPTLTSELGELLYEVTLHDNVICGSPTKGVYRARWDALGDHVPERWVAPGEVLRLLDSVDFAHVGSERAHRVESPKPTPAAALFYVEDQARRFDGCRMLGPEQEVELSLRSPDGVTLDTPETRLALRGRGLGGARWRLQMQDAQGREVAEPQVRSWDATDEDPTSWQLATSGFRPHSRAVRFRLGLLAGPYGSAVCSLWWRNTR